MFRFRRFPELPTDTDGEHDHHQHHHLYSGLPPAAAGEEGGPASPARSQWRWERARLQRSPCPPGPQESISDFYWYYSGKDVIEEQGKRNFSKAMSVAKQVFNSLTEYIQVGPGLQDLRRQSGPIHSTPAGASCHCLSSGPLHWKPAESGAQPPLGCRGGLPARVCPHDDEAGSGLSSSVISPLPLAIPYGPQVLCPCYPDSSLPVAKIPSGLVLCMLFPLPPPIGSFPTYTSIWIPAPTVQNSPLIGWYDFLSDEVIPDTSSFGQGGGPCL